MRKILSLILALSIICSLGIPAAFAAEAFDISYTTPNTEIVEGCYIGVNQETIEIGFTEAITSIADEAITFTDSEGTAPTGGITVTYEGSVVTVGFGELKENETYTLTVTDGVTGASGSLSEPKTYTFTTLKKAIAEEDFDDLTLASGLNDKNSSNTVLSINQTASGDNYMTIKWKSGVNTEYKIGFDVANLITGKVVSKIKINETNRNETKAYSQVGSMFYGKVSSLTWLGQGNNVKDMGSFTKNSEDFYEIMNVASLSTVGAASDTAISVNATVTSYDTLSDNKLVKTTSITNKTAADFATYNVAPIYFYANKSYNSTLETNVSYLKSGYYTIPAPVANSERVYDEAEKTFTYVLNTDVTEASVNSLKVGDLATTASYDKSTRALTVTYTGDMRKDGRAYTINLSDLVSTDGFKAVEDDTYQTENTETLVNISYTTPNTTFKTTNGNNIGVNQETIEIGFAEAVTTLPDGAITFTDSDGNTPAGGVIVNHSGAVVTLRFGELKENEIYTLSIGDGIKCSSGNYAAMTSYEFKTLAKVMVNEDFNNTDSVANITANKKVAPNYSIGTTSDGDNYLKINPESGSVTDFFLGTGVTSNKYLFNTGKIVSRIAFKEASNMNYGNYKIGTSHGDKMQSGNIVAGQGVGAFANFTKNANGFYEIVNVASIKPEGAADASGNVTGTTKLEYYDLLSDESKESVNTNYSKAAASFGMLNVSAITLYVAANATALPEADISYFKSGFYTFPEIMINKGYDSENGTITYVMNTDLDTATLSKITLNGASVPASYNAATRELTITPASGLVVGDNTVSLTGVESADGFKLTYTETIVNDSSTPSVPASPALKNTETDQAIENLSGVTNVYFEIPYEDIGCTETKQVIIAVYEGNKMVDVEITDVTFDDPSGTETVPYSKALTDGTTMVRAMIWDLDTMFPVIGAVGVGSPE